MSGHKGGGVVSQAAGAVAGIAAAMLAKKLISVVWVAASGTGGAGRTRPT